MRFCAHLLLIAAIVLASCAKKDASLEGIYNTSAEGQLTPKEAGDAPYRYAFSGQILNESTGQVVQNFAVALAGSDPAVNGIINSLGDLNGLFHISRNPRNTDPMVKTIPLMITAAGFEPFIHMLDLGADCQSLSCAGVKPAAIALKPIQDALTAAVGAPAAYNPAKVVEVTAARGVPTIFNELVNFGKLDPGAESILAKSKNGQILTNMLVLLNGNSSDQTGAIVNGLLGGIQNPKLQGVAGAVIGTFATLAPLLASSSPEVAAAILAVNVLLPYLQPVIEKLSTQNSPIGKILAAFLKGSGNGDVSKNLSLLISALQGNSTAGAQLAMGTLLPLFQSLVAKGNPQNPFNAILTGLLNDPNFASLIGGGVTKDKATAMLLTYLQPLIQGFVGKQSPELQSLFNQLIAEGGLKGLKNFGKDPEQLARFAALVPYMEPIVRALNSKDATAFASALLPLVNKADPSGAIASLITKIDFKNPKNSAALLTTLFPGMGSLLKEGVPGKQMFAAQLLQGLTSGAFKNLQITQDLKGAPAVIVTGQARDIFKLAQLPNVDKIVSLGEVAR